MNCEAFDIAVGDYVDGTLDAAARAGLEAHLETCGRCRALAADFTTIRSSALALEPAVPPPHVWTKLSTAFDEQHRRRSLLSWHGLAWPNLAAAAMTVVLASSLSWLGGRLASAPDRSAQATADTATASPVGMESEFELAEQQYKTAIDGLERVAQGQADALDSETVGVLRANLTLIDAAIGESRTVLQTEPESTVAQDSLFEALRSKVALLQETVALINEMRKGNQDEAARIVTGLNNENQ